MDAATYCFGMTAAARVLPFVLCIALRPFEHAFPRRSAAGSARAFSGPYGSRFGEENATKQRARAAFRFP